MTKGRKPEPRAKRRGRPPGSTSDATRGRILRAARVCFAKTGYVATTNKDIAAHAEISAAAIYQYFDSKKDLFAATVRDAQQELVPRFQHAAAQETTARARLRAIVLASADLHHEDPTLAKFLSSLPVELQRHEDVAGIMGHESMQVTTIFAEIVEQGVDSGEVDPEEAPHLMAMFIACTMGLSLYAAAIDSENLRGAAGAFVALMDGALFRPKKKKAPRG